MRYTFMTHGIMIAIMQGVMFEELDRHMIAHGNPGLVPPREYPKGLERRIALRNGETLLVRPIRPDDEPRLEALYGRLSRQTAYQRFFSVRRRLPADWFRYFANVDYRRRLALVVERETVGGVELVGVGRYEPSDEGAPAPDTAEVAFVLEDGYQGQGLGAILLEELVRAGAERGLRRYRAHVLAENHRMLRLLAARTRILAREASRGEVTVLFEPQ